MTTRSRVDNRAHLIYNHLVLHMGQPFTITELCKALTITDGSTTRSAIRRARDLAAEAGYHFPPAVPANGFHYMVTNLPAEALDPAIHMGRIETGVRKRKEDGIEFMRRERKNMPSDLRPTLDMYVGIYDAAKQAIAQIQKLADDFLVSQVKHRRDNRRDP